MVARTCTGSIRRDASAGSLRSVPAPSPRFRPGLRRPGAGRARARAARRRATGRGSPSRWPSARSVVLLVLDGLGWDALEHASGCVARAGRALDGRADHHRRSRRPPPRRSRRSRPACAPSQHGLVGFRIRVDGRGAERARRGRRTAGARPTRRSCSGTRRSAAATVPVVTKSEFHRTGFTEAHLRGGRFHGWRTRCRRSSSTAVASSPTGEPFVYAYYPGVDEVAHAARARTTASTKRSCTFADRLVGDLLDALARARGAPRHRGPRPGAPRRRTRGSRSVRSRSSSSSLRRRRAVPLPLRATGCGRRAARRRHARRTAAHAWVCSRDELVDDGLARARRPAAPVRRRIGDVVLAAVDERRVHRPHVPARAAAAVRARVAHAGRDVGPTRRRPGDRRSR